MIDPVILQGIGSQFVHSKPDLLITSDGDRINSHDNMEMVGTTRPATQGLVQTPKYASVHNQMAHAVHQGLGIHICDSCTTAGVACSEKLHLNSLLLIGLEDQHYPLQRTVSASLGKTNLSSDTFNSRGAEHENHQYDDQGARISSPMLVSWVLGNHHLDPYHASRTHSTPEERIISEFET